MLWGRHSHPGVYAYTNSYTRAAHVNTDRSTVRAHGHCDSHADHASGGGIPSHSRTTTIPMHRP